MAERGAAKPITVYLDQKSVDRIREWAEKLGQSQSRMTAILVEDALIECGYQYDLITSRPSIAIMNLYRQMSRRPPICADVDSGNAEGSMQTA